MLMSELQPLTACCSRVIPHVASQATHDAWRTTKKTSATVANAPRSFVRMFSRFGGSSSTDSLEEDAESNRSFLSGIAEGR